MANLPRATARAEITDRFGQRHLIIETIDGDRITRVRLTGGPKGRGTWPEVHGHITQAGLKFRTQFRYLPGGGVHVATLIPA